MRNVGFQICRQIYNVDSSERAFLGTNTASYTETLGNEGDFRFRGDFDTKTSTANNGAGFLAFLSAFLQSVLSIFNPCIGDLEVVPSACTIV